MSDGTVGLPDAGKRYRFPRIPSSRRANELTEEQIFHSYAGVTATQEVGVR